MSQNSVMIDLETIATTANATVLTIGAVRFDPYADEFTSAEAETLYLKIDLASCEHLNLDADDDTLAWWATQPQEAQDEAFGDEGRVDINDAFHQLYKFCSNATYIWSHGAAFDVVICENIFRKLGKPIPWKFWNVRCTRTLFDLGITPYKPAETAHHALVDAYNQVLGVQSVFKVLSEHSIFPLNSQR